VWAVGLVHHTKTERTRGPLDHTHHPQKSTVTGSKRHAASGIEPLGNARTTTRTPNVERHRRPEVLKTGPECLGEGVIWAVGVGIGGRHRLERGGWRYWVERRLWRKKCGASRVVAGHHTFWVGWGFGGACAGCACLPNPLGWWG
jgi:hypothetical protein